MLSTVFLAAFLASAPQGSRPRHVTGDMVGEIAAVGSSYSAIVLTASDVPADATVFYSKDRRVLETNVTQATSVGPVATGVAGTAHIEVRGLAAGTRYYYRTRLVSKANTKLFADGAIGEFSTPPKGAAVVKFAVSGDFATGTKHPMLGAVMKDDPAFYISLGDFPYCDVFAARFGFTLDNYRLAHALNRASLDLQAFLHKIPVYAAIDDHEVADNWDADTKKLLPQLVTWGRTAFKEWLPIRAAAPDVFYRSFRWGPGVRVIMLDTRSHRGRNADPDLPQHSMLGAEQKRWFENELRTVTETFTVIVSSVPLRSGYKLRDHWEGYQRERRWMFDTIAKHGVKNVVFLTGDHHYAAIHHHPEGHVELITGPITASIAKPPAERLPETRDTYGFWNYGLVTVDTTKRPATMTLECRSGFGTVFRHVIEDRVPAELELSAGLGDARFTASGPRFLADRGSARRFANVAAGKYRFTAQAEHTAPSNVSPVDVVVEPGGYASVGVSSSVTAKAYVNRLFSDDFSVDGGASTSHVVDVGTGPSAWFTDGGSLWQSSTIAGAAADEPGTLYIRGDSSWTDQVVRVGVRSWDSGRIGVVARYRDPRNFYHFQFDGATGTRTLSIVTGGKRRVLAQDRYRFATHRCIEVELGAVGQALWVKWDGERILAARANGIASGRVGLSTGDNEMARFDRLRVFRSAPATGLVLHEPFSGDFDAGWATFDAGSLNGPGRWFVPGSAITPPGAGGAARRNGVLRQASNISGPGPNRPGTVFYRRGAYRDFSFSSKLLSQGNGAIGALFRVQGPETYYRFSMDDNGCRLELVVKGAATALARDSRGFELGRWYDVELLAHGPRLSVRIDGEEVLSATDQRLDRGGIGFYAFDNAGACFDEAAVRVLGQGATLAALVSQGPHFSLEHHDPAAATGDLALVLMSTAGRPPIDMSFGDPSNRLLPLKLGQLLLASLGSPGVAVFGADGVARYRFPASAGAALRGARFVIGGIRIDPKNWRLTPLASTPVRLR